MTVSLAVIGQRFSEPATRPDGRPIDLAAQALPRSADAPEADRLLDALARATREMRLRQRNAPMDTDAPLWLGLVLPDRVETTDVNLQEIDFAVADERADVIEALHTLERQFLKS